MIEQRFARIRSRRRNLRGHAHLVAEVLLYTRLHRGCWHMTPWMLAHLA